jgi:outer membrane protein
MQSIRTLTSRTLTSVATALAGVLALAPTAFAQDIGTQNTPTSEAPTPVQDSPAPVQNTSNSSAVASAKRFTVVGGIAMQKNTGNANVAGQRTNFDSEAAPSLSASYNINDNIAIEAWGVGKSGHRMNINGGKVASVESQPVAVSGQYHFRNTESIVRPFVGLGYYQSNINHEKTESSGALAGQRLAMSTPKGAIATAGVDLALTPTWFARADARYLQGGSDIAVNGAKVGRATLNPVVVGVGIGARF